MRILFVIPGDINTPTGGYRYDLKIIESWRQSGHEVRLLSLSGNYPFPSHGEKHAAIELIREVPEFDVAVVDGLAGGAHPELMHELSKLMPAIALVHHPLCLENGLTKQDARMLEETEKASLSHASGVVTTSKATAMTVIALFGYNMAEIETVIPGVERAKVSIDTVDPPIRLLCVASIIERKGHTELIQALSRLGDLDWHLDCVGMTDADPSLYSRLQEMVSESGQEHRIQFHGSVERSHLEILYEQSHIFVLPSRFEGYGMVYAEAIVRGLPVIGTTAGAIPDTVPDGCGILVEPENVSDLSDAIRKMICDTDFRDQCKKNLVEAAEQFPDWAKSATRFLKFLEKVA